MKKKVFSLWMDMGRTTQPAVYRNKTRTDLPTLRKDFFFISLDQCVSNQVGMTMSSIPKKNLHLPGYPSSFYPSRKTQRKPRFFFLQKIVDQQVPLVFVRTPN